MSDTFLYFQLWEFFSSPPTALRSTQPPIQWVSAALCLVKKRLVREADHSPPSSAEVKECGATPPLPQYAFMALCSV
jgi:hypothetical protein